MAIEGVKLPHIKQVAARITRRVREFAAQVGGKPFGDSVPPTFGFLFFNNLATQIPLQGNHLGIDRENRLDLRRAYLGFDCFEPHGVFVGHGRHDQFEIYTFDRHEFIHFT